MTTKKDLEDEIRRINLRAYDLESKCYAEKIQLTNRILKQEETINRLVEMLEKSGTVVNLTDDNGLRPTSPATRNW